MDARHLCTVILARNYPKLVAWYRKALQMKPKQVTTGSYDWTELARPGLRIGFTPAVQMGAKLPKKPANAVILHLVSKDVPRLLRHVKKCGAKVPFGPTYDEKGKYTYGGFVDIEGNTVWVIDLEAKK